MWKNRKILRAMQVVKIEIHVVSFETSPPCQLANIVIARYII